MRLLVTTLALALSAFGADLTGKWKGSMQGRDGNAREISFQFKADAGKLTGSMTGPMGNEVEISDGKVDGQNLSFKVVLEFNGNAMSLNYTGKLEGDDLKLKMQREGAPRAMEMMLKKAGS